MDPQVIEYVQGQLGSDPIEYDPRCFISLSLFHLFRCRRKDDVNVAYRDVYLEVKLPSLFLREGRTYIGYDEIRAFEMIMRSSFEERIIDTICERLVRYTTPGKKTKYKEAVLYAHQKFGLSEEILPYQTLWKRVQRYRESMETP